MAASATAAAREIARDCLAVRLRVVSRGVSALYDQALRPYRLKVAQLNLLVAVAAAERIRPGELSRLLVLEKSTASRNLERLLARGLLESRADADGRSHFLLATREGHRLLEQVRPAWRKAQERARELLGEGNAAALRRMAGRLTEEMS